MTILFVNTDFAGQIYSPGIRRVKIITTDSLSTVQTAGYLNGVNLEGYTIKPTDIIDMWYGATGNVNSVTSPGTYAEFLPTISNGIITLNLQVNYGNVLLPVVSGDLAVFNGTNGQISDSGVALSSLQVFTTSVTLTQSQIQGMYAAPVQIVAAPGAGKVIIPTYAVVYTNFQTAAFTAGGVAILQYNNTADGAGTNALSATIPTAEITAAASQVYALPGHTSAALTAISNQGLFFSNQTQAFAGGNAASTVVVTVNYQIITATV